LEKIDYINATNIAGLVLKKFEISEKIVEKDKDQYNDFNEFLTKKNI